jgi:hypothetical protein
MPEDTSLDIEIRMPADTSGGTQAAAVLDKVKQSAGESAKEVEKHNSHLHVMHKLFHGLNEVVPGLGVLMQAAFSPVGAAISLALMALRAFHEKMKETNAEFKKMEDEAAKPVTHRLEALRDATVNAAVGMAQLDDRLAQAARGEQSLAERTTQALAASKQQAGQASSVAEAMKQSELAGLDVIHSFGLMSEQQYADAKLKIELDYIKAKTKAEEDAAAREIQIKQAALAEATRAQPGLEQEARAAELRKVKAAEDLAALQPRSEIDKSYQDTKAALKAFEDKHPENAEFFGRLGLNMTEQQAYVAMANAAYPAQGAPYAFTPGTNLMTGGEQYKQWAGLKAAANLAELAWKQAPGVEAGRTIAKEEADRAEQRAAKKAEENEDYIIKTQREIGLSSAELTARKEADTRLVALQTGTLTLQNLANSPTGQILGQAAGAEAALQHGQTLNTQQQSAIQVANQMLSAAGLNANQLLSALGKLVGHYEQLTAKIRELEQKIDYAHRSTMIP